MKLLKFFSLLLFSFFLLFQGKIIPQCSTTDDLGYYQENNSSAIISHSHNTVTGGNCIGFAIASTQQSYIGPICGLAKEINIGEAYAKNYWLTWGFYIDAGTFDVNNIGWIQYNDILIWDTLPDNLYHGLNHAAVVTGTGLGSISIKYVDFQLQDDSVHFETLYASSNFQDSKGHGTRLML